MFYNTIYCHLFHFKRISEVPIWKKAVQSEIEEEDGLSTDHISVRTHAMIREDEAQEGKDTGSISGTLIEGKNPKEDIEDEEGLHTNQIAGVSIRNNAVKVEIEDAGGPDTDHTTGDYNGKNNVRVETGDDSIGKV